MSLSSTWLSGTREIQSSFYNSIALYGANLPGKHIDLLLRLRHNTQDKIEYCAVRFSGLFPGLRGKTV